MALLDQALQSLPQPHLVSQLTLPNDGDPEAQEAKGPHLGVVAPPVRFQLRAPKVHVGVRELSEAAGIVPVPKAPMDKDRPSMATIRDVRSTGQTGRADAIPSAQAEQDPSDGTLGGRVALPCGFRRS
jgi:hypothetical protein